MKLLKLQVKGYRSLKNVSWQPGDLNILIGPNASGKTNLVRVLQLLAMSARGELGEWVQRQGGIVPMLWDGQERAIHLAVEASSVSWGLRSILESWAGTINSRASDVHPSEVIKYEIEIARMGELGWYVIPKEALVLNIISGEGEDVEPSKNILDRSLHVGKILDPQSNQMVETELKDSYSETLLSVGTGAFPFRNVVNCFRDELAAFDSYVDFRTDAESPVRAAQITRSEHRLLSDGSNLPSFLHTCYERYPDFKADLDLAMRSAFGEGFDRLSFPPAADQRIQLAVRWKGLKRPQTGLDLSDGTLRFLFLLAALANPEPPPLIAIEEPEIGLHPSMFPIIAEFAADAANRTQVIITTHSPDFLDAFGDTAPTTTVFHWRDGQTILGVLEGDELKEWLKHYRLGEYLRSGEFDLWLKDRFPTDEDSNARPEPEG